MKLLIATTIVALGMFSVGNAYAQESNITYMTDPVFESFMDEGGHPLQGLFDLGNEGDARALFILGDLYSKGKGGVAKDIPTAKKMFEYSAKRGAPEGLIRLAAIAKDEGDKVAAYKWYHVAERRLTDGRSIKYVRDAQNALALDSTTKREATKAGKAWETAKLPLLRLNVPTDPFKAPREPVVVPANQEMPAPKTQAPRSETVIDTTVNP